MTLVQDLFQGYYMGSTTICFNSDLWAHVVGSPEISGMLQLV